MKTRRGGPNGLSPEDRALWDTVSKSIKPLRRARHTEAASPDVEPEALKTPSRRAKPAAASTPPVRVEPPKPPPLAQMDRRTRGRIARGRIEIGARLDLHGMTLERARTRLAAFLSGAQARGESLVLVITGKGQSGRGALKHEVPHWLSLPDSRALVIGFEEAAPHHGGSGALYVRIRRSRSAKE